MIVLKRYFRSLKFGSCGIFSLKPFHRKIHRAIKRETKWYFYQWTYVGQVGACFENYLAVQLSAACSAWREQGHGHWEIYYLRGQDRREVDFLICCDLKPMALIEAKSSFQSWPWGLTYYCKYFDVPGFLVYPGTAQDPVQRIAGGGWTLPSCRFLSGLVSAPG